MLSVPGDDADAGAAMEPEPRTFNGLGRSCTMKRLVVVAVVFVAAVAVPLRSRAASPKNPFEGEADPVAQGRIDELVLGRLKQLGIAPARVCSDGVFVRRLYLDVIGMLPTAEEARQFLQDPDRDKRRKLIDRLLERSECADYWAMK